MKLSNSYNLPQPLVDAIANDSYNAPTDDRSISITTLFKPPRIVALERKHRDELTVDAIDSIWSLMGQSIHTILERANKSDVVEKRLGADFNGWYVNGQLDRFVMNQGLLMDWKTVSAWSIKASSKEDDWALQLNSYAWLLRRHGYEPKALQIVALIRDWHKREAERSIDYPQKQVEVIDIPMMPDAVIEAVIADRLELHSRAETDIPDCTPADRWLKPPKFAVMKVGGKRAIKLFDSEPEAKAWAEANRKPKETLFIDNRPGEAVRCKSYCAIGRAGLCAQWIADPLNVAEGPALTIPEDI